MQKGSSKYSISKVAYLQIYLFCFFAAKNCELSWTWIHGGTYNHPSKVVNALLQLLMPTRVRQRVLSFSL